VFVPSVTPDKKRTRADFMRVSKQSVTRMRRVQPCTFAKVYNQCYTKLYTTTSKEDMHAWVLQCAKRQSFVGRHFWSRHMLTIIQTQAMGRRLTENAVQLVDRTGRLCHIGRMWRLRRLQRRILQYLWRPLGSLFLRHRPEDMLHK
jgi:hypothetical protein